MNYKKIIGCLFLLCISIRGFAQTDAATGIVVADTAKVNELLQQSKGYFTDSPAKAIDIATQASDRRIEKVELVAVALDAVLGVL